MKTVLSLFLESAEKFSNNTALVCDNKNYTYREINSISNRFAHLLHIKYDLKKNDVVLFHFKRSYEAVITLLSLLKLGCTYVPIVKEFGQARIEFIHGFVEPRLVISDTMGTISKGPLLCYPELVDEIKSHPDTPLPDISTELDPLCILFTSGSTGMPKGVLIHNKGIVNRINWMLREQPIQSGEYTFQNTKFTTVDSLWEIFAPLVSGNPLLILDDDIVNNPQLLIEQLVQYPVRRICLVPSLLDVILDLYPKLGSFAPTLKLWVTSGEILSKNHCTKFYTAHSHAKLYNQYGLTESSADVSSFDTSNLFKGGKPLESFHEITVVPIGEPIDHTGFILRDESGAFSNTLETGELCIYGDCLSPGYLNNPGLNETKYGYVELSLKGQPEKTRVLFTGDFVRKSPDGSYSLINRLDDLINIRGYKIYPQEVEVLVTKLDMINKCKLIKHPAGDQLCLYFTIKNPKQVNDREALSQIQQFCWQQLPEYMQPSFYLKLDGFATTVTGKLDVSKLPKPEFRHSINYNEDSYRAPTTETEHILTQIWSELLVIPAEDIGTQDNFFMLGGHSLLATRLRAKIRERFHVDLTLKTIFDYSLLSGLAQQIAISPKHESAASYSRQRPDIIPLSFAQQRLWFIDQLLPGKGIYNIPLAFDIKGDLNRIAIEKALKHISFRHEILRTQFQVSEEGIAQQVIIPQEDCLFSLTYLECSKENDIQAIIERESLTPFDLNSAPLWRALLIQKSATEAVLLIVIHHVISDGWSLTILTDELSHLYDHYAHNKPLSLPALPIQYVDFTLWQREWLQGEVLDKQLAYWKRHLEDISEELNLPTDKSRPKILSYAGKIHSLQLNATINRKLKQLGEQNQASLYMVLLAAFNVLLYRYTQQKTIVVGSPIANRHYQEVEGLIGFFVNTLPLRTNIAGEESFVDLLKQIRLTTLNADQYQDIPFEQLVDHLAVPRILNKHPLFQVMLIMQNTEPALLSLEGAITKPLEIDFPVSKFDLTLEANETPEGGLHFRFEYATDLFETSTIERLAKHFVTILEEIVKLPLQQIDKIPFISDSERKKLLIDWNETKSDYPKMTIPQLFEQQVLKTPDHVALSFEGKHLTYQELNARANSLAHELIAKGLKPETLVGLSVERGFGLVIGLLGILKAGGAYVPLDPSYPQERLHYIFEDTKSAFLVTESHLKGRFGIYSDHCIELDSRTNEPCHQNPITSSSPEDLMYILYTSGSTGKPKGVMITQKSVVNLLFSLIDKVGMTSQDKLAAITSIGFDIAGLELFAPLMIGATIVLSNQLESKDAMQLSSLIQKNNITVLQATPAAWRMLLDEGWEPTDHLKMLVGGEALPEDIASRLLKKGRVLWNVYGPTETTIWSTAIQIHNAANITIGRPLANTETYILDTHLQPLPEGLIGELYIGGDGLALGYFNRPDLTDDRFISHPFTTTPYAKIYRTGDLATYLPDGRILYAGRADHQVKLRGYRIELGEIESVLRQHTHVKDTVVIVREDDPGQKRLVAYLVSTFLVDSKKEAADFIEELRQLLNKYLPEYMIPSAFKLLEQLPLNLNGKIDRKALPKPEDHYRSSEIELPRNIVEKELLLIWSELLSLEVNKISTTDNFFNIGGNSLLLFQVLNRINHSTSLKISVLDIYQHPTINKLATFMTSQVMSNKNYSLLPIRTGGTRNLFLVHAGATTVLPYLHFANLEGWSVYGINNPYFGQEAGFKSITEMAICYLDQIKEMQSEGPYYVGGWSLGGTVALEIAHLLESRGEVVAFALLFDTVNWQGIPDVKRDYYEFAKKVGDGIDLDPNTTQMIAIELEKSENLLKQHIPNPFGGRTILLKARGIDKEEDPELIKWLDAIAKDPMNNWQGILSHMEAYSVEGTHSLLFRNNDVFKLVDKVEEILNALDHESINKKELVTHEIQH